MAENKHYPISVGQVLKENDFNREELEGEWSRVFGKDNYKSCKEMLTEAMMIVQPEHENHRILSKFWDDVKNGGDFTGEAPK